MTEATEHAHTVKLYLDFWLHRDQCPNFLCCSRVNCTPLQSPQMDSRDVGNRELPCDLFMKRKEERPLDLIKMLFNSRIIAI